MTRSSSDAGRVRLEALYRDEQAPMLALAVLLVGSRAQAEEIVQDAFAAVGERLDGVDNPGGYLRTTVVNGCRMALRRREIEQRHAGTDRTELHPIDAPHELVELREALDALTERQRTVVVLRYFADAPDDEIASVLGCRPGTVRSLVHRALRTLRKELA
ncbi:MAG: RNA polymerase sigma factor [Acidimicrobiia bacterium]